MARILITGASGFVGFHSCIRLVNNRAIELVLIDSLRPLLPSRLTEVRHSKLREAGATLEIIDLETISPSSLLKRIGRVDIVLHLAAFPGVRLSPEQEIRVLSNNSKSFDNIVKYCQLSDARLLYASSSSIYGDQGLNGPCREADIKSFTGKGAYSLSKWENERTAIKHFDSKSLDSLGLRFFSVFGTYGRRDMAYYKFADQILKNEPLIIFDSIADKRDYTPIELVVDDVENLIKKLLTNPDYIRNSVSSYDDLPILNIGNGEPRSLGELIKVYEKYFGRLATIKNEPRRIMESKQTWSNNDKRNSLLPERSTLEFTVAIEKFAKWFEESEDAK